MAIAENNMRGGMPLQSHAVVDLNARILVRPMVVVHKDDGSVDAEKSALGLPKEISLQDLKTLLGVA